MGASLFPEEEARALLAGAASPRRAPGSWRPVPSAPLHHAVASSCVEPARRRSRGPCAALALVSVAAARPCPARHFCSVRPVAAHAAPPLAPASSAPGPPGFAPEGRRPSERAAAHARPVAVASSPPRPPALLVEG